MSIQAKFDGITTSTILEAAKLYKREDHSEPQRYVVNIETAQYPVKAIGVIASNLMEKPLTNKDFTTAEFQKCLKELGFTVELIYGEATEALVKATREKKIAVWRCATSWFWGQLLNESVITMQWLDYRLDYSKPENRSGEGKRSKTNFVDAKAGELIVLMDKANYFGIARITSSYQFQFKDILINGKLFPCLGVEFLHALDLPVKHPFEIRTARPDTFFRLDGLGFSSKPTFSYIDDEFPGTIENVIKHVLEGKMPSINQTNSDNKEVKKHPINQILFGPPGTGKTYHTVNRAMEIIDPNFYKENKDNREALHREFDRLLIKDWGKGQWADCFLHLSPKHEL